MHGGNLKIIVHLLVIEKKIKKIMRCIMDGLDGEIVATIQRCLSQMNSFVEMFLRVAELVRNQENLNVRLTINEAPGSRFANT
jgi:hypothetical protein